MTPPLAPFPSVRSTGGLAATADHLATQAAVRALDRGGSAADAAVAANAVLSVTAPHLCGMGGDLFALVHATDGPPEALNACGRAGSGADAEALRDEGHTEMPFRHDARTVTVPGCVDGWQALHDRFGRLAMGDVLAPAVRLADEGFPASPLLVGSMALVDDRGRAALAELATQATAPGAVVRRPGVATALRAIAADGRRGFYEGAFGAGLLALGEGTFAPEDLAASQADWVEPLGVGAWDRQVWTIPPGSQGYLTLSAAWVAAGLDLPPDPDHPAWAHLLVEAVRASSYDRPDVLHEGADGAALVAPDRLGPRRETIRADRRAPWPTPGERHGDTTYLCVVDSDGMGVSLIQSNASGFGSWVVEPATGINLHNRGLGFSLEPGHPAEHGPGRRPPSTLSPALVTESGRLNVVLGTMGGDGQPQILVQLLARLLHGGQSPAQAVAAGRWVLSGPGGFDAWTCPSGPTLLVEGHAPAGWADRLAALGHPVVRTEPFDQSFGHAHVIAVEPSGVLSGAADPRARVGSAAGR